MNDTNTALIIVSIAIAAAIAVIVYLRMRPSPYFEGFKWENETRSPKGVRVVGKRKADKDTLILIDRALDYAFEVAEFNGYTGFTRHDTYIVSLQKKSDQCRVPSFLLKMIGGDYDQSEFDKDPKQGSTLLCVAGKFELWGQQSSDRLSYRPILVVVDDPSILFDAVYNEAEHAILFQVDPNKFNRTAVHADGQGHPILEQPRLKLYHEAFPCGGVN